MDRWIVDGLVNAAGVAGRIGAWVVGVVDRYVVDGLVNLVADTTLAVGSRLRAVQTGRVQSYIYGVLGGVVCIALLRYLLG
jgi:NADH-quinone oxidoreductase subunit L